MPEWPVQRLVVARPEYRQQCVALFETDARKGKRVSAASPLARRAGVTTGMPLAEARSLLEFATTAGRKVADGDDGKQPADKKQPDPFFLLSHEVATDEEALREFAWTLDRFSPVVGIEQDYSLTDDRRRQKASATSLFRPSCILLDVSGLEHLFGGEASLAGQVQGHCLRAGYLAHIAIADSTGLAWGVAHFHPPRQSDNICVVESADSAAVMASLDVAALRLAPHTLSTLYRLGIDTIGQLMAINRGDLRLRLGDAVIKRLDQMAGDLDEPIVACHEEPEFTDDTTLEYPTSHRETIEVVVARLVESLCVRMKSMQRGALQWNVRLICQDARQPPVTMRVNLFQAALQSEQVMPLVAMQLERALLPHLTRRRMTMPSGAGLFGNNKETQSNSEGGLAKPLVASRHLKKFRYTTIEVKSIIVEAACCVKVVPQQKSLFDHAPGLDGQRLSHLINALSSRLGAANVVYPVVRRGAQPEWSCRFLPLVDPSAARRRASDRSTGRKRKKASGVPPASLDSSTLSGSRLNVSHVLGRPVKLIAPPVEVEVQRQPPADEIDPAFCPPYRISVTSHVNRSWQGIASAWGPERIETGWWKGTMVRRDYWRVVTEQGRQFWVFCDLKDGRWFLHGEF